MEWSLENNFWIGDGSFFGKGTVPNQKEVANTCYFFLIILSTWIIISLKTFLSLGEKAFKYSVKVESKVSSLNVKRPSNSLFGEIFKKLHKFNKVGTLPTFLPFSMFLNKSIEILTPSETNSCVYFKSFSSLF